MPNTVQLKRNGQIVYPITDVSCVMGLEEGAITEAILCWDGASTPVVADIPAGVVVTYNTTNYTGTLAASASTVGKIYMVATGTNNVYDRYMTFASGQNYSWQNIGNTTIDLSTYATQAELEQLEAKVDDLNNAVEIVPQTNALSYSSADDSPNSINTSTNKWEAHPVGYAYMMLPVIPGAKYTITTRSNRNCKATMLAEDTGAVGDDVVFATGWSEVQTLSMNTTTVWEAPANAKYLYIQRANNEITVSPSSITERVVTSVIQTLKEEIDGLVEGKDTILQPVNFADYLIFDYGLNTSTLKWGTNASYKHTLIPVPADAKTVIAKAASSGGTRIAWLDTMISNSSGADASITAGTTVTTTVAGEEVTIQVPEDAKYMYVYLGQLTDGVYPYKPSYLAISSELVANNNYGGFTEKQAVSTDELLDITTLVGKDIDLSAPTRYKCYVTSTNTWSGVAYCKHFYIPVNGGDVVFIRPKKNCYSTYTFTTTIQAPSANGGSVDVVPGVTNTTIYGGNTARVIVPSGAKYICFTTGDTRYVFGIEGRTPDKVIVCPPVLASDSIVSLNPDSEFIPKMMSAKKRYYTSTDTTEPSPLVIAHLSDIHGNWDNVARFIEFTEHHSSNIDLLLNTGDTVESYYSDGITGYADIDGAEDILNVIGNHDTRGTSEGLAQWRDHIGVDAYNLLIKPFVGNWGVIQPEDAETNGYCYYYKDFTTKHLRFVVVDMMAYDATQDAWLAGVLANANESGLHIVIATHYAGVRSYAEQDEAVFDKVSSNYTTLYSMGGSSANLTGYNTSAYLMGDTVDAFIQNGGKFVGYLQGHYHADFVAKVNKYPGQLIFAIGSSKSGEVRDFDHIIGTRNQDEFQIVAIDTVNTIVKLYKVGANYDRYGRKKGSICVDYTTGQVLGEGW